MPKVKVKGKVKHFPYDKKGKLQAQMAAKEPGAKMEIMNRPKVVNRYGIRNLKGK
jgi:hypothetical protein